MTTEEEMGMELKEHNEKIVHCIYLLREQRDELAFIINKQYEEKKKLENEMERITYKLCLINKSLMQRVKTKENYDKTIVEIEEDYAKLVKNSGDLLIIVEKEFEQLDSIINKKTSTEDAPAVDNAKNNSNADGEGIRRSCRNKEKDCQCDAPTKEIKTKERKKDESKRGEKAVTEDPKPRKTSTNSTQYSIADSELPTKLAKQDKNESVSSGKSSQADETPEPDETPEADDEEDEDSIIKKTEQLEHTAYLYNERTRETEAEG